MMAKHSDNVTVRLSLVAQWGTVEARWSAGIMRASYRRLDWLWFRELCVRVPTFAYPPIFGHEWGQRAIPKPAWPLCPPAGKFLPFSNRPHSRH